MKKKDSNTHNRNTKNGNAIFHHSFPILELKKSNATQKRSSTFWKNSKMVRVITNIKPLCSGSNSGVLGLKLASIATAIIIPNQQAVKNNKARPYFLVVFSIIGKGSRFLLFFAPEFNCGEKKNCHFRVNRVHWDPSLGSCFSQS